VDSKPFIAIAMKYSLLNRWIFRCGDMISHDHFFFDKKSSKNFFPERKATKKSDKIIFVAFFCRF